MFGNKFGLVFTIVVVASVSVYVMWKTTDLSETIRQEEEVVLEWVNDGVHTTPLGKIRVYVASVKWIGPLLVGPVTDPLAKCGINPQEKEGNLWWFIWPRGNTQRLQCLRENINLERQRHSDFANRWKIMMIILPVIVSLLLVVRHLVGQIVDLLTAEEDSQTEDADINEQTQTQLIEIELLLDINKMEEFKQANENVLTEDQTYNNILEERKETESVKSTNENGVILSLQLSNGTKLTYNIDEAAEDFTLEDLKSLRDTVSKHIKESSSATEVRMAMLDAIQRLFCHEKRYKTVFLTETECTEESKATVPIIIGNNNNIWETYEDFLRQMKYT